MQVEEETFLLVTPENRVVSCKRKLIEVEPSGTDIERKKLLEDALKKDLPKKEKVEDDNAGCTQEELCLDDALCTQQVEDKDDHDEDDAEHGVFTQKK